MVVLYVACFLMNATIAGICPAVKMEKRVAAKSPGHMQSLCLPLDGLLTVQLDTFCMPSAARRPLFNNHRRGFGNDKITFERHRTD